MLQSTHFTPSRGPPPMIRARSQQTGRGGGGSQQQVAHVFFHRHPAWHHASHVPVHETAAAHRGALRSKSITRVMRDGLGNNSRTRPAEYFNMSIPTFDQVPEVHLGHGPESHCTIWDGLRSPSHRPRHSTRRRRRPVPHELEHCEKTI